MSFTATLNQTLMVTALPQMVSAMHVGLNLAQWLTTGYVLVLGIMTPVSALLYEKFNNRPLFMGLTFIFTCGSLLGALSTSFWVILAARLIQAAAGGIIVTLTQILLMSIYPLEQRGSIMGYVGLTISAAPAIGPTLSGIIINYLDWHALFSLTLPITILILIAAWFIMPNYSTPQSVHIDLISLFESLVGLGLLLASFSFISTSPLIGVILFVTGALITWLFVKRQFHLQMPFLNLRLLGNHSFRAMTLFIMLVFGIMMGTETLLPLFTENVLHISALNAGLMMLPGAALTAICAPFVGRLYDRYGIRWLVISGIGIVLLSCFPFFFFSDRTGSLWITLCYAVRMFGISLLVTPATTEAFKSVSPQNLNHATALNNSLRQISGSFFNTIMIMVASLPASFVTGFHLAIGVTFILALLLLLIEFYYQERSVHA
ncbi:hypothetical protein IV38_GL000048 [Lactobacillus selangorensis]|uniref:Major facilitator superfamily (MFS) profile domain-containing protein n=2 Tax=Lactobacillus selangorensis TaxID=81857 RepID=A0A0R2FT53_9LACO|nr:hypothetical protein IV38_GL000048 [Lactobacillus selangorensis]KRN31472.1 hypothetical protein IV40_GL001470 [Lactobacillus selangorensis]